MKPLSRDKREIIIAAISRGESASDIALWVGASRAYPPSLIQAGGAVWGMNSMAKSAEPLKAGDILVLDNLAAHKVAGAVDAIYQRGASVLFLPPYSPDFNPIELSWSKMKAALKRLKPRNYGELISSLKFAHNGYV